MRIIAGTARGRRFEAPEGMDTRPTLDRVKEALFGMLQFDIPGSRVLDLFSGSGNLGLEAASRGAEYVLCNDHSRPCTERIRQNAALLGLEGIVSVSCMDYAVCVEQLRAEGKLFDFAFLDAPYADGTAAKAAELLFSAGLIANGGRVIIEHAANLPPAVSDELAEKRITRRYGACAFTLYARGTRKGLSECASAFTRAASTRSRSGTTTCSNTPCGFSNACMSAC